MQTHATAVFADRHSAHAAIEQLAQAGFPKDAISVVMSEETHEREFGAPASDRSGIRPARGVGVLGAIVAVLVPFTRPEGPALRVGGPLVAALTRAGGLPAALLVRGLKEDEARAVDAGLERGGIVVGVLAAAGERTDTAMQLLELSGGSSLQAA